MRRVFVPRCAGLTVGLWLIISHAPQTQGLSRSLKPLALFEDSGLVNRVADWCGTTHTLVRESQAGIAMSEPLSDGRGVRAIQVPRFLTPTHTGPFGFNNFTVVGDHETLTFRRNDPWADDGITVERWRRVRTATVGGQTVSVFRPRWSANALRRALRRLRWGVDQPVLFWGEVDVPAPATPTVFGTIPNARAATIPVELDLVPPGLPPTPVRRINSMVQYSSHVVNIWVPGFGDSRVAGGDTAVDLEGVIRTFYQHFQDTYEMIAVISQTNQLASYSGFHGIVRNDISGLGLDVVDDSARYGSAGTLMGIEFYSTGDWMTNAAVLHETGHQWGDFSRVWDPIGATAAAAPLLRRQGHDPEAHTPLLFPGAVMYGAVLEGSRRVNRQGAGRPFRIEHTLPLVSYNPLTLYRMGHLSADDLPTYRVFARQGQFDDEHSAIPPVDTRVRGRHFAVEPADFVAADGTRTGPTITRVRRAFIYVTRMGLAPKTEMDIVNYFAARHGAQEGVTSWDRYPSFFEATGGRARMPTAIRPKENQTALAVGGSAMVETALPIVPGPHVAFAPIARRALVGMTLDRSIPGRLRPGQSITLDGRLTLTERSDYSFVCFRFARYGASTRDDDEIYDCGPVNGGRFSVPIHFATQGTYLVAPYVFWPNSGRQFPRSIVSTIVVDGD